MASNPSLPSFDPSFTTASASTQSRSQRFYSGPTSENMSIRSNVSSDSTWGTSLLPGVALVTGAASGIGAAVAKAFADAGCRALAITDIDGKKLLTTKDYIISKNETVTVLTATGDIADEKFVQSFVDGVIAEVGRLDYAVNCAGVLGNSRPSTETSAVEFDRINDINYRGSWLCSRAELRVMMRQDPLQGSSRDPLRPPQRGAIVNIASQLGIVGKPECTAYSASKAAVMAMTRGDAIDYSQHGIRVNCICPGVIDTPMTTSNDRVKDMLQQAIEIAPMKRMGRPEEVADCAMFLCSHKASFVQGASLVVDGGYIIN